MWKEIKGTLYNLGAACAIQKRDAIDAKCIVIDAKCIVKSWPAKPERIEICYPSIRVCEGRADKFCEVIECKDREEREAIFADIYTSLWRGDTDSERGEVEANDPLKEVRPILDKKTKEIIQEK